MGRRRLASERLTHTAVRLNFVPESADTTKLLLCFVHCTCGKSQTRDGHGKNSLPHQICPCVDRTIQAVMVAPKTDLPRVQAQRYPPGEQHSKLQRPRLVERTRCSLSKSRQRERQNEALTDTTTDPHADTHRTSSQTKPNQTGPDRPSMRPRCSQLQTCSRAKSQPCAATLHRNPASQPASRIGA